jgi:hypothetical protein
MKQHYLCLHILRERNPEPSTLEDRLLHRGVHRFRLSRRSGRQEVGWGLVLPPGRFRSVLEEHEAVFCRPIFGGDQIYGNVPSHQ